MEPTTLSHYTFVLYSRHPDRNVCQQTKEVRVLLDMAAWPQPQTSNRRRLLVDFLMDPLQVLQLRGESARVVQL